MREPLLLPLAAFVSGILLAGLADFRPGELAFAATAFLALALLSSIRGDRHLRAACLLLAVVAAGIWTATVRRPTPPPVPFQLGQIQTVAGCVDSPLSGPPDRPWFYLEVAPRARIRVSFTPDPHIPPGALQYGRRITAPILIRAPIGFRNPGSFDYAAYLAVRDVFWQGRIPARTPVALLDGACGTRWQAAIYNLRARALERLDALYANSPFDRGMMKGLLVGDASEIRRVWVEDFRRTGTYHALVISGSHISFLAGLFILWLRWSRLGEGPILILACSIAWLYALVAGADPPVVRSAAGFTLAIASRFFYRRVRLVNVVAAVALVFLAVEPWQLQEASFQLSFLAVAAIAAIGVPLIAITSGVLRAAMRDFAGENRPKPVADTRAASLRVELLLFAETIALKLRVADRPIRRAISITAIALAHVWELAVVSAAVQLALVLPMVFYFHRLSLSGLSANILATPLITAAIPFGFLAVLGNLQWAATAASVLLDLSLRIVVWHASWEPNWRVPDPSIPLALAFTAGLLLTCVALRLCEQKGRRWIAVSIAAPVAALAWIVLYPASPDASPGQLELSAIDVGQGDSFLLTLPDGRAMLLDTGGLPSFSRSTANGDEPPRLDTGEDVVSPYLWSRRYRHIDVLALSHVHQDHAGGAPALIRNFQPRELWIGALPNSTLWRNISTAARETGTRVRQWRMGETETLAGVHFAALTPLPDLEYARRDVNEESLALRITFGRHRFLFTGDMDRRTERLLLDNGEPGSVDVLKVGHHGSRRSSHPLFLDAARPAIALISAGAGNTFNHPHPDVVEELRRRRSMILRTDLEGLVTIRSDGFRLEVDTMRRSRGRLLLDPF